MWHSGIPEFREMWEVIFFLFFRVSYAALGNSGIPGNVGRVCVCTGSQGKVYCIILSEKNADAAGPLGDLGHTACLLITQYLR